MKSLENKVTNEHLRHKINCDDRKIGILTIAELFAGIALAYIGAEYGSDLVKGIGYGVLGCSAIRNAWMYRYK